MFVEVPGAVIPGRIQDRDWLSQQQQPLIFLSDVSRVKPDLTLGLGVNLRKEDKASEIDLTVVTKDRRIVGPEQTVTAFVEAKGLFRQFDASDVESFERLLPDFPDATFVFSTLRTGLTEDEQGLIQSFFANNRTNGARHNVVVLTRNEMRSPFRLDKQGKMIQDAENEHTRNVEYRSLDELGSATRARYPVKPEDS